MPEKRKRGRWVLRGPGRGLGVGRKVGEWVGSPRRVRGDPFPFPFIWRGSRAGVASECMGRVESGSRGENLSNFPVNRWKPLGVGPLESRGRPGPARDLGARTDSGTLGGCWGGQGGSPGRAQARLLGPVASSPRSWKRGSRGSRGCEFPIGSAGGRLRSCPNPWEFLPLELTPGVLGLAKF